MFAKLGVPVISTDEIGHELLKTNHAVYQAIKNKFGNDCLDSHHNIDRKKLAEKVFSSTRNKQWLEALLHPLIRDELVARTKNILYPYCIVEIPLLIEAGWQNLVDRILTVDCSTDLQMARAKHRDGSIDKQTANIIANQITREERRAASNDIIENAGDLALLKQHVEQLHHRYLNLAAK